MSSTVFKCYDTLLLFELKVSNRTVGNVYEISALHSNCRVIGGLVCKVLRCNIVSLVQSFGIILSRPFKTFLNTQFLFMG